MRSTLSLAFVVVSLFACGKKKEGGTETPPTAGSGTASGSATATTTTTPPAAGGKGMAAAANDQAVVALFKAAIACKVDEEGSLDSECPALKALDDSTLFEDGKADATLLNLIEDGNDKVRLLAYDKLDAAAEKTVQDKAAAERMLAAAEAEKTEANVRAAADVVGRIDVKATGTFDRLKKYFESGSKDVKKRLAGLVVGMSYNTKNDEVWAWHKSLLGDPEPEVARAAMGAYFGNPGNLRRAEVCVIYKENFGHKDPIVAAKAASGSAGAADCSADLDAAIDEVEKRGKANQIPSDATDFLWVLGDPYSNSKATPAQKTKKQAVAKGLATNTALPANIRRGALEGVNKADPAAGKALATTLVKDKDIGDYAKSIVDKK